MGKKSAIGGGVLAAAVIAVAAYWKWGMNPDQKDRVCTKLKDTANNLKEKINEMQCCGTNIVKDKR